jgi:acyl carrier protein phosphodiesterase
MTIHEGADLHKRVERYEAAVDELRAAHRGVKDVLTDHVLFERWEQVGADLGFSASAEQSPEQSPAQPQQPQRELSAVNHHDRQESWAS